MTSTLDEYRRYAADHGAHSMEGDADATNAAHDRLQEAFLSLARGGKRRELFKLYDDPDLAVQCWAAAHTLEVDEARALAKLAEIEKAKESFSSMDAEYTIKEWKLGVLHFLPQ